MQNAGDNSGPVLLSSSKPRVVLYMMKRSVKNGKELSSEYEYEI